MPDILYKLKLVTKYAFTFTIKSADIRFNQDPVFTYTKQGDLWFWENVEDVAHAMEETLPAFGVWSDVYFTEAKEIKSWLNN